MSPAVGDDLAMVVVVIVGGEHPGTYPISLPKGCVRGVFGPQNFDVQETASDSMQAPEEVGSFRLVIGDVEEAATGTDNFDFEIVINAEPLGLHPTAIEGVPAKGTGTAILDDHGDTASIHLAGTFEDGATVTVDVDCHSVDDPFGIGS